MSPSTTVAKVKLIQVGNALGATFSKDVLTRMKVGKGDTLYLTETADGYRITPYDPEFEAQMEAGRQVMREHRDTLRELAK
ncbi:MAG: AbrB/MazE/SpoVT family DNA-binding domain-containing protein [Microvirga sp.]